MSWILPHTLHGYDQGHRLLAVRGDVDASQRELLDRLSDLSGLMPLGLTFKRYHTGFPCGSHYAFACTWPDHAAPRSGAVLTHTLLLPMALLTDLPDLWAVGGLHHRPRDAGDRDHMRRPLSWSPPPHLQEARTTAARERGVLALAMGQPARPILWSDTHPPEDVVAYLWGCMPPEDRAELSFCTFSLQPRQVRGRRFTFLGVPPPARGAYSELYGSPAWWEEGQPSRSAIAAVAQSAWVDKVVREGPQCLRENRKELARLGLPPLPAAQTAGLIRFLDVRGRASERLAAARARADLLASLWPDLPATHEEWRLALHDLVQLQGEAPLAPQPLWELSDLLGRPQLRARADDLADEEFAEALDPILARELRRRLEEAPTASAVGLPGLAKAVAETPREEVLRRALQAALRDAPTPTLAREVMGALSAATEPPPEPILALAWEALREVDRPELIRELRRKGQFETARRLVERTGDSSLVLELLSDAPLEAARLAMRIAERGAPGSRATLRRTLDTVMERSPVAILEVALEAEAPGLRDELADAAVRAAHRSGLGPAELADYALSSDTGLAIFTRVAADAGAEPLREVLRQRPELALRVLRKLLEGAVLRYVVSEAALEVLDPPILLTLAPAPSSSSYELKRILNGAGPELVRALLAGEIQVERAASWLGHPATGSWLEHGSRHTLYERCPGQVPGPTSVVHLSRVLVEVGPTALPMGAVRLLSDALRESSAEALEEATPSLVTLLEAVKGTAQLSVAASSLEALRRRPTPSGHRLVVSAFGPVYDDLSDKRGGRWVLNFLTLFWPTYETWDKAKPWRHWVVDTFLARDWPMQDLLRALERVRTDPKLLARLQKHARKRYGSQELPRRLAETLDADPSLAGTWSSAVNHLTDQDVDYD